ncbi:MAG: DUF4190 domain-containing protein [Lachnospiraceae bacterium]|nr:DUF4190 domain-containing protein [Lachnospiraceae bacterium]
MLVKMICPRCGASLEIDDQQEIMGCKYCGYQQANLKERVEITHIIDRSNDPNLYISYNTTDPNVQMVTRIVSTGQKNTYINGQSMSFHLPTGQHEIVLKIGKKNYNRTIVIPENNQPVRISASFSGRANIGIDQPNYQAVDQNGKTITVKVSSGSDSGKKKNSGLGITAFILSLTMFLSPVAIALGFLDIFLSKKKESDEYKHGLAIAAMIIGVIMTFALIASCVSSCNDKIDMKQQQKEQSREEETKNEALTSRMSEYRWPRGSLAEKVPQPKSNIGVVDRQSSEEFIVYVGEMSTEDFNQYIDQVYEAGFSVNYSQSETRYEAENADGDQVLLSYEGDDIVLIHAWGSNEDTGANTSAVSSGTTGGQETDAHTEEKTIDEGTDSETDVSAEDEPIQETETGEDAVREEQTGINPELKEFVDSYEAFVDEYVEFMENYDSSDAQMLADYTEMLTKLAVFEFKSNRYNESEEEMSEADAEYYSAAMMRISNKLLSIAQ